MPIDSTLVLKPLALAGTSTNMLHNMFIATTWVQLCTPYFFCTQRLALAPADAAECWTAPPIDDTLVSMPLALAGINMLHKMLICNMGATVHTSFSLHTKPSACACRCSRVLGGVLTCAIKPGATLRREFFISKGQQMWLGQHLENSHLILCNEQTRRALTSMVSKNRACGCTVSPTRDARTRPLQDRNCAKQSNPCGSTRCHITAPLVRARAEYGLRGRCLRRVSAGVLATSLTATARTVAQPSRHQP